MPFRNDRSDRRKKGGVITYIHNELAVSTDMLFSESNSYAEAQIQDANMIFINIYRPSACPTTTFLEPLKKIQDVLQNFPPPMPIIMLTGNLNFPLINWESERVYGGAADMHTQADALFNLATDFCLTQYITTPTRGKNILDIVMTNDDKLIQDFTVEKKITSDHKIVNLQLYNQGGTRKAQHWKQN